MARIHLRNGARRAGRRRRHHYGGPKVRRVMPARPRKPASAFNLFIRHYFRTPMARNFHSTSESMKYAGQFWRTNPGIHAQYIAEVRNSRANFARDLAAFKLKQNVLKRPGNAFIYFARNLWQTEGQASGKTIAEFGKDAGAAWKLLPQTSKQPYIEQAIRAKQAHSQMLDDVARGTTQIGDYLQTPQPHRAPVPIVHGNQPGQRPEGQQQEGNNAEEEDEDMAETN